MAARRRLPKRLRVMAEYGSSGVWVAEACGPFRHGMIEHKRLSLPDGLAQRFAAWIERYWAVLDHRPFDVESFNAEGRSLAVALKAFVGAETEVVFEPETAEGGLGVPETIRSD